MSFGKLLVRGIDGERAFGSDELPLRVGTGSDCQLRLPGPGGDAVAMLDLLDGLPIVQPIGRDRPLRINDTQLNASRRLEDGDVLQFYGSEIRVSAHDNDVVVDVHLEDSAYVTTPPQADDTADRGEDEEIAPTAFQRASEISAVSAVAKRRPLKFFLGGALTALLAMSFLLFTSKSIEFAIDPPEADVSSIEGGWFRFPIGNRVLLRTGTYTVNVEQNGYYDVGQTFIVGDEASMSVRIRMRRKPGRMSVATVPKTDATVTIDESLLGKEPYGPIELEAGFHSVRVEAPRYLPFTDLVEVSGLDQFESLHVQLTPRWADVAVSSEPAGALILSGGNEVGVTPATIQLLEGTHELTISKDGFSAWDGSVTAEPNVEQSLPMIRLQAADARLRVNTIPRGANVTVNGRYRGPSPITLSLTPDIDYQIGFSKAGYGVSSRSVRLQSAASESITVDLSARVGTVTLNVEPADAAVIVDGRTRGTGKTILRLSSAPHRIEVKRQGFRDWSTTITPRPGYPQTLTAKLRSLAAIARDSVARTEQTSTGQTLRRVEGGTFSMGASRAENGRRANEVIHPVTIVSPFLIGTKEVSNKEFSAFRKNHDSGADVHASLAADNNPVANVTWGEAVQYCNWLSKSEGRTPVYKQEFGHWVAVYPFTDGYRLPTEAEWAWAIRYSERPVPRKFPWGKNWPPPKESGNFSDLNARELVPSIIPNYNDGYASTAPVGTFKPSALGIYDGGGNVAEWVNDLYTVPTPGRTEPEVDPIGPVRGTSHVIRGSSWRHAGFTPMRLSYRDYGVEARVDLGFRIARNVD